MSRTIERKTAEEEGDGRNRGEPPPDVGDGLDEGVVVSGLVKHRRAPVAAVEGVVDHGGGACGSWHGEGVCGRSFPPFLFLFRSG